MSKSGIVYFCIAIICLICVPVMAYIYLPAAFIYLLPAAVFLWLSKDICINVYKAAVRISLVFLGKVKSAVLKINFKKNSDSTIKAPPEPPQIPEPLQIPEPPLKQSGPATGNYQDIFTDAAHADYSGFLPGLSQSDKAVAAPEPEPVYTPKPEPVVYAPEPEPAYTLEPVYTSKPVYTEYYSSDDYNAVKNQFANLDMITLSAIAIMLGDTKAKAASPYIKSLKKTDIRTVLLRFLKDTYNATDIAQLNKLFNKTYYKRKVKKYMRKVTVFVKSGISDSLPKRNMWLLTRLRVASRQKKAYIEKLCESINSFESVKYISALSGNKEISDSKKNYKLDHLSDNYKDALIYMVDFLLSCTCISKMLFVESMIRRMPANSEFKQIIENMANSIDDHNLIISKSRPIYKQYYQAQLGYIGGDDLLYGMAITIMVNNIKKTEPIKMDIKANSYNTINYHLFERDMQQWLDSLAKDDNTDDIGTLILHRITLSIKGNYDVLITALGELLSWENYYNQRVAYHKRERDKERYLRGDFDNEVIEMKKFKQK